MNEQQQIPVTVLTGYLGAGKTTLLNRILSENHGKRYAVIVNEYGEIGIDNDLIIESDEEIYEMNNGCVCCTVRGDLIRVMESLIRRRGRFDAIIIETTGLADPAPVAQTFFLDEDIRTKTKLDAVVTLVDAMNLPSRLKDSTVAENQIAFADIIVLNKTDLVTEKELHAIEHRLHSINPRARIHRTVRAAIALSNVLNRNAFDLSKLEENEAGFLSGIDDEHGHNHDDRHPCDEEHHHHDTTIQTISLRGCEMDSPKFVHWITQLTQREGQNILRLKGIIAFKGDPDRYVIQGVHMIVEGVYDRAWRTEERHQSRLVFIGRQLDIEQLRNNFNACQVP